MRHWRHCPGEAVEAPKRASPDGLSLKQPPASSGSSSSPALSAGAVFAQHPLADVALVSAPAVLQLHQLPALDRASAKTTGSGPTPGPWRWMHRTRGTFPVHSLQVASPLP
jgi:hypothetical protein